MALIDRSGAGAHPAPDLDELIGAAQLLLATAAVGDCTRAYARSAIADLADGDARSLARAARLAIADGRLPEGWLLAESGSLVQAIGSTEGLTSRRGARAQSASTKRAR